MAANGLEVWQIGTSHGDVDPRDGAAEYPATKTHYPTFDYYVGLDPNPVVSPIMPGLIGPFSVHEGTGFPGHPGTDATSDLYIHFGLVCNYGSGELTLIYDRYGSEKDFLYLDGTKFAEVTAAGEGRFSHFAFDLGPVSPGNHTIRIQYAGGGAGNGHYIDYLKLDSTFVCEVAIDIKPGSDPNCFNSDGHGVIPVAILGSEHFDASTVDPFTAQLDGALVRVKGKSGNAGSLEDVNSDGYLDLVVQIVDDGAYSAGDTTATLTAFTYDGLAIEASDSICIRPPE